MLYTYLSVLPYANIGLFKTALLKYLSKTFCWYIVVAEVKGTEAIILARTNLFNISTYHYYTSTSFHCYTVSPFHHFNNLPFYHSKHTIIFVTLIWLQDILPHVNKLSLFPSYSSYQENLLWFLGTTNYLNIRARPFIFTIFKNTSANFHTFDHLVPYKNKIFFLSNITQKFPIFFDTNSGLQHRFFLISKTIFDWLSIQVLKILRLVTNCVPLAPSIPFYQYNSALERIRCHLNNNSISFLLSYIGFLYTLISIP